MLKPLLQKLQNKRIILASGSKQRASLLSSTVNVQQVSLVIETSKLSFEIYPSNFEENLDPSKYSLEDYVLKTALGKVDDVYEKLKDAQIPPDIIIGADTMVAHNNKIYGKPKNKNEAFETIKILTRSGIPNVVYTGVIINYSGKIKSFTEVSKVYMVPLTDEEIKAYVDTAEPMGKAGGYGIQGVASTFVQRIEGDYNNVIGLPLCRLTQALKEIVEQ